MDALEVMDNLTNIYPKFQPMYHAGNHEIAGFEVTPHLLDSEGVEHHLSAFIYDNDVPEEYRRQVDMQTRAAAFQIMQNEDVFLYVSINASLYTGSEADNLLEEFKSNGVPAILGVVCTDDFSGWEEIKHFTYYLQRSGLKVAMKSLAYQQLTLRDLSHIKPDVVEMDMQSFQIDLVDIHRELFHTYSVAAGKIGASLLFRGIGNFQQLKDAWQSGARYIQGDFLSTTKRDGVHEVGSKGRLQKEFQRFLTYEQERIRSLLTFTSDLGKRMEKIVSSQSIEALDAFAYEIGKRMDDVCFRVYIVNAQGEQQTANMFVHQQVYGNMMKRTVGKIGAGDRTF
ncbi:EAL domain protein [Geomicrobium sp. JCM 19039]|nr:EAL domain protein [Geomicrobium sp. JCM 19039]